MDKERITLTIVCPDGANLTDIDVNELTPSDLVTIERLTVVNDQSGFRGPLQRFPSNLCSFTNLKVIF